MTDKKINKRKNNKEKGQTCFRLKWKHNSSPLRMGGKYEPHLKDFRNAGKDEIHSENTGKVILFFAC